MTPPKETNEEILKLLAVLPLDIQKALRESADLTTLIEVVLDLGKPAEARFAKRSISIGGTVNQGDIDYITARVGQFLGTTGQELRGPFIGSPLSATARGGSSA